MLPNGYRIVGKTLIVNNEANDPPIVFEHHISKEVARFIEHESSPVIKSAAGYRCQSCQDSEEKLLHNVVKLWMATRMLSDSTIVWKFSVLHNPHKAHLACPLMMPQRLYPSTDGHTSIIHPDILATQMWARKTGSEAKRTSPDRAREAYEPQYNQQSIRDVPGGHSFHKLHRSTFANPPQLGRPVESCTMAIGIVSIRHPQSSRNCNKGDLICN